MDYDLQLQEVVGKQTHDPLSPVKKKTRMTQLKSSNSRSRRCIWVPGAVIVGAGPSGMAAAACLRARGIPSLVLERFNCIASLWQLKTYDRLRLHLPKQYCELPLMGFPAEFPTYPTKQQFVAYLEKYAERFEIRPRFNTAVESAEYDGRCGLWRVRAKGEEAEYACRWLVVATGENAEAVVPEIEGMGGFRGRLVHSSAYKTGHVFKGNTVLVVGCGNSGMELSLDLCNHNARPSLVIRDSIHVLPQQMLGTSTFGVSMWLLKWFPIRLVDHFILLMSRLLLGDTSRLGLRRPKLGPLQLKNSSGKTPVLDVGTLDLIRSGRINVFGGIRKITPNGAEFVDGRVQNFDAIILATGYKSNVPYWLKESEMFNEKDGWPRKPFPNGWKGERGLYAVGFTNKGLLGGSMDAMRIADHIESCCKADSTNFMPFTNCLPLVNL